MRALRSRRLRYYLSRMNDGRCAICGEPLTEVYHIDHRDPYWHCGETKLGNLQATHPLCNLKKGKRLCNSSSQR